MNSEHSNNSAKNESVVTLNKLGRTTTVLNEINQRFVEEARHANRPVLDLGCAMGVATLAALEVGATVYANDVDENHLKAIQESVSLSAKKRLHTISGWFPEDLDFEANSFDVIHASNLLNFLSGPEIDRGLQRIYEWLSPNGIFLSISGSPYAANIKGFIPEYEKAVALGETWPGECDNLKQYSSDPTISELPDRLHLLDPYVLSRSAKLAGMHVEESYLFNRRDTPKYIALDGRENVVLIARKIGE